MNSERWVVSSKQYLAGFPRDAVHLKDVVEAFILERSAHRKTVRCRKGGKEGCHLRGGDFVTAGRSERCAALSGRGAFPACHEDRNKRAEDKDYIHDVVNDQGDGLARVSKALG